MAGKLNGDKAVSAAKWLSYMIVILYKSRHVTAETVKSSMGLLTSRLPFSQRARYGLTHLRIMFDF